MEYSIPIQIYKMSFISKSSVLSSQESQVQDLLIPKLPAKQIKKHLAARRTRQYMLQFQRFLGQKLAGNRHSQSRPSKLPDQATTTDLIANEINKRKLLGNNSQTRVNKMMDGFKAVNTYVNVKNFIQDMNAINRNFQKKGGSGQGRGGVGGGGGDDGRFYENLHQEKVLGMEGCDHSRELLEKVHSYLRPHMKTKSLAKLQQFDAFYKSVDGFLSKTQYILGDVNSDIVELAKECRAKPQLSSRYNGDKDDSHIIPRNRKNQPRQAKKLTYLIDQMEPPVIDNKYCEEFHQNLMKIEKKMQQTLKTMYLEKWEEREKKRKIMMRQSEEGAEHNSAMNKMRKPILNQKYRVYAPRNVFRYKVGNRVYDQKDLPHSPAKLKGKHYSIQRSSSPRDRCSSTSQKPPKFSITLPKAPTPLSQHRRTNTQPLPPFNTSSPYSLCSPSPSPSPSPHHHHHNNSTSPITPSPSIFSQTVKQNYRFRKPMIKQNILKKVEEFIKKTEDSQGEMRRKNQEIGELIGKVEQQKALDFDMFNEEKVEICLEDVKKWAGVLRNRA